MSFLSLLAVLVVEQLRPLPYRQVVSQPLDRLCAVLEERLNAGEKRDGMMAWLIGVGGCVLASGVTAVALASVDSFLAWLWNVCVLYWAMGFRRDSDSYHGILLALRNGDLAQARRRLADWRGQPAERLAAPAVARLAIEHALGVAHRHFFAVAICFVLLPGPCGAVLYRVAALFAATWNRGDARETANFGSFARRSFAIIDWLPVRLTAATLAVVGDFERAFYSWRACVEKSPSEPLEIVLASGAGALRVRLGETVNETGRTATAGEFAMADEADADYMESAMGLIWRALVLWLLFLCGLAVLP